MSRSPCRYHCTSRPRLGRPAARGKAVGLARGGACPPRHASQAAAPHAPTFSASRDPTVVLRGSTKGRLAPGAGAAPRGSGSTESPAAPQLLRPSPGTYFPEPLTPITTTSTMAARRALPLPFALPRRRPGPPSPLPREAGAARPGRPQRLACPAATAPRGRPGPSAPLLREPKTPVSCPPLSFPPVAPCAGSYLIFS